ncbi:UDP-N-acetylmuramoyl-L-alanyl-D-glutamate--2,6-diaminopimelate ligase [Feifania hominis]|uniref:UDP-N-acetylmuramoyl-L-alanyl-D-glutamate--2,6-diaminopimelate ligase n=1 Tax=Feifania hominis TaxID=2763660 RepID=A0A926DDT6_9FIRM|nr:UDP-N-acetylmuramoyl-L-alanyl-D-glutamate--2,6-diaminopimelate ligase [Feifania hominis]MBC8535185.1 UDP-N-acetylmuramoyl-L-alanyl-D-glutamate--2,6-diaminopimelate ligase [Feifania hominis]
MKLRELLRGVDVVGTANSLDCEITGVCQDSRKATPGCLFVAVDGVLSDGHKYIPQAMEKGAAAVVVEKPEFAAGNCILVRDSRKAVTQIAANFYSHPAERLKLIGITGTNGKTTTTYIVKHILEQAGHRVGLIGTIQNMIGERVLETEYTTPESIELQALFAEMADAGVEYVVMEVSSHSLAQHRVDGLTFEVGIFTNLTQDHLDFHGTMQEYLKAKAMLFSMSKIGVLNADDPATKEILAITGVKSYTYSVDTNDGDITAKNISLKNDRIEFEAVARGMIGRVEVAIPGKFTAYNVLASIGCCLCLGLPLADIIGSLKSVTGVKGRVEVVPTGRDFTVLIDYSHTPDSLYNVLQTIRGFAEGRVVTVFGCGGDRDRTKRPKMGKIAADLSDFAVVTSDNPRTEDPHAIIEEILVGLEGTKTPYVVVENRRDAIGYALAHAQTKDVILLAGKGHETYQVLAQGKIHFDEREIVAELLGQQEESKQ